jgi:glutamate racemase
MHKRTGLRIVFTDSGLGGLSACAKFHDILKTHRLLNSNAHLIYFNALPQRGKGYSKMQKDSEKIETFNAALKVCKKRHNPHLIAIACNTLSALYLKTSFSENNKNVIEIITSGKEQIAWYHNKYPQIPVIVLATQTTKESGVYFLDQNYPQHINGGNLASLIEENSKSDKVITCVRKMFSEIKMLTSGNSICLFLGCTHYGYIEDIFQTIARETNFNIHTILDPVDAFLEKITTHLFKQPAVDKSISEARISIESQAEITREEINSIGTLLETAYPQIVFALKNYKRLPEEF